MSSSNSIQSAVAFLRDPSVQDSSLAKKVAFLEAKGLSQQEVDTALRLAAATPNVTAPRYAQQQQSQYGMPLPSTRPDYRDWFIMAVVGGGVGTLAYSLARKYIFPALKPPSESELVAAQQALTAKYDEAAAILADLQEETHEIKTTLQDQCSKVDESVEQVNTALQAIKDKEKDRDEELQSMREEVDSLKALMEKMFDKHKDAQTASLGDIQQEVKSLKSILSRRTDAIPPSSSSTAPSSSLPQSQSQPQLYAPKPSTSPYASSGRFGMGAAGSSTGRESPSFASITNRPPGIPAWQMQSQPAPAASSVPESSASSSSASASSLLPPSIANAPASATASSNSTEQASGTGESESAKAATINGNTSSGSDENADLAESAEMVDANDITA